MHTPTIRVRRPAAHVTLLAVLGLLLALVPGFGGGAAHADSASADRARSQHAQTASYILQNVEPSGLGREWAALGLARSDVDADQWLDEYYDNLVEDVVAGEGDLGPATTYERVVIALSAMGKNVTDVGGYDLLAGLADMSRMRAINSAVYGLIALDTLDHQVPEVSGIADPTTRQKLVDRVLQLEIAGGGWAFFGSTPDPDITGMALQALSRYVDQPVVAAAVERGVTKLSDIQRPSGAFASYGVESVESTTQVLLALTALGIDPATDPRFAQEGGNPVTAHATFFVDGGGFWYPAPGAPNGMATLQGFYGLTDYLRFLDGKPSLYAMSVPDPVVTPPAPTPTPIPTTPAAPAPTPVPSAAPPTAPAAQVVTKVRKPRAKVKPRKVVLRAKVSGASAEQGRVRFVVRKNGKEVVARSARVDAAGVATVSVTRKALRKKLGSKKLLGQYKVVVSSVGSGDPKRSSSTGTFRLRAA